MHYPLEISPSPTPRDFTSPRSFISPSQALVIDFSAPETAIPTSVLGGVVRATTTIDPRMLQQQQQHEQQHTHLHGQPGILREPDNHIVEQDVHVQSTTDINNVPPPPSGNDQVSHSQMNSRAAGGMLPDSGVLQNNVPSAGTPDQTVHSTQPDVGPTTPTTSLDNR